MNIKLIYFLNQLKNASLVNKSTVCIFSSKMTLRIATVLYEEGYLLSFKKKTMENGFSYLILRLKERNYIATFKNLKLCSTPSKSVYLPANQLFRIRMNYKLYVFSTNKGILTGLECKKEHIGGVLLFYC